LMLPVLTRFSRSASLFGFYTWCNWHDRRTREKRSYGDNSFTRMYYRSTVCIIGPKNLLECASFLRG
jgi:hypothetical protein